MQPFSQTTFQNFPLLEFVPSLEVEFVWETQLDPKPVIEPEPHIVRETLNHPNPKDEENERIISQREDDVSTMATGRTYDFTIIMCWYLGGFQKDNAKKHEHFWWHMWEHFLMVIVRSEYLTKDPLTTEFRKINKYVTKFNNIYNNLLTQRKHGEDDEQTLEMTLKIFLVDNNKKSFKFIDVWRFLSKSSKWIKEYGNEEGGEKRTKATDTKRKKAITGD